MKRLVYRNCSLSLLITSIFIFGGTIILCVMGIHAVHTVEDSAFIPVMRYTASTIIGVVFCIPCLLLIIDACISFSEKIVISEETVVFYRGNKQIGCLVCQKMTLFGCASFMHRNGYIFFCSTPMEQIWNFLQQHQKKAINLFGRNRFEQASKSREGCKQIAVGTYIQLERRKNQDNIIILKNASFEVLKEVSNFLHKEPILTGPIIMEQPNIWYH